MVNAIRGESTITFDGETFWTMRPTFDALAAIESDTGASLMILATRISTGTFVASEVISILHLSIVGSPGKEKPTRKEIGAAVFRDGYPAYREAVIDFLKSCLSFYTGPDTDDDDEEDPTEGQETA